MNCAIYSWKKFTLNVRPLESKPVKDCRACSCLAVGAIVIGVVGGLGNLREASYKSRLLIGKIFA